MTTENTRVKPLSSIVAEDGSVRLRVPRPRRQRSDRRSEILQTLAMLLQNPNCDRITTALIAKRLDVSEAVLYRCFPSKAEMFDGLITFVETSILEIFAKIRDDDQLQPLTRVQHMVNVLLEFADANPGLTRVMTGQALMKEDHRLTERIVRLSETFESWIRQAYKEAILAGQMPADFNASGRASLVMSWVIGRWLRFVLTGFKARPNGVSPVALAPFFTKD